MRGEDGASVSSRMKIDFENIGDSPNGTSSDFNDARHDGAFDSIPSNWTDEAARSDPDGPLKSIEGWIVIVTGVHEECVEENLFEAFEEFGSIRNLHLNLDRRTGFVKGYAFIEYASYQDAKKAIHGMRGREICGVPVNVDWAFSKKRSRGRHSRSSN